MNLTTMHKTMMYFHLKKKKKNQTRIGNFVPNIISCMLNLIVLHFVLNELNGLYSVINLTYNSLVPIQPSRFSCAFFIQQMLRS